MRIVFFLIFALMLSSCSHKDIEAPIDSKYKVEWHSYSEGFARALSEKKLVFMDVYADWCYPCKQMDHEVFNRQDISEYLKAHFVSIRVDYEADTPLACGGKLKDVKLCLDEDWKMPNQVSALPFLAFFQSDGKRLLSHTGQITGPDLLLLLKEMVIEYGQ